MTLEREKIGQLQSATTDANGNYAFSEVPAGTFEVGEILQQNWVQTQPFYPTLYTFTPRSGTNLNDIVFADRYAPAVNPSAVITNGQPDYAETGSWSTALGGYGGTSRVASTTAGSSPTATASWTFTGLALLR